MPLKLLQLRFGELKVDAKFLGHVPGDDKKRVKMVKTYSGKARLQKRRSTMLYEIHPDTFVFAWRWSPF